MRNSAKPFVSRVSIIQPSLATAWPRFHYRQLCSLSGAQIRDRYLIVPLRLMLCRMYCRYHTQISYNFMIQIQIDSTYLNLGQRMGHGLGLIVMTILSSIIVKWCFITYVFQSKNLKIMEVGRGCHTKFCHSTPLQDNHIYGERERKRERTITCHFLNPLSQSKTIKTMLSNQIIHI